jgi:hypothetical protein
MNEEGGSLGMMRLERSRPEGTGSGKMMWLAKNEVNGRNRCRLSEGAGEWRGCREERG